MYQLDEKKIQKTNIDSSTHVILPFITYQDKTGTEEYQRYLTKPLLTLSSQIGKIVNPGVILVSYL